MTDTLNKQGWEVLPYDEADWAPDLGTGQTFKWAWRALSPHGRIASGVGNKSREDAEKVAKSYRKRMQSLFDGEKTFNNPGSSSDNMENSRKRGGVIGSAARASNYRT